MKPSEAGEVILEVNRRWPRMPVEEDCLSAWRDDLLELEFNLTMAAVRDFAREGREFPPSSGQLHQRVMQLRDGPQVDFDQADRVVLGEIRNSGSYRRPQDITWPNDLIREYALSLDWLAECRADAGDPTFAAQRRRRFADVVERHARRKRYATLGLTEGPHGVQRWFIGNEEFAIPAAVEKRSE
jgi:hypothetical protein